MEREKNKDENNDLQLRLKTYPKEPEIDHAKSAQYELKVGLDLRAKEDKSLLLWSPDYFQSNTKITKINEETQTNTVNISEVKTKIKNNSLSKKMRKRRNKIRRRERKRKEKLEQLVQSMSETSIAETLEDEMRSYRYKEPRIKDNTQEVENINKSNEHQDVIETLQKALEKLRTIQSDSKSNANNKSLKYTIRKVNLNTLTVNVTPKTKPKKEAKWIFPKKECEFSHEKKNSDIVNCFKKFINSKRLIC